jgi:hypothetical protein
MIARFVRAAVFGRAESARPTSKSAGLDRQTERGK